MIKYWLSSELVVIFPRKIMEKEIFLKVCEGKKPDLFKHVFVSITYFDIFELHSFIFIL